jgi:hypothetical protein
MTRARGRFARSIIHPTTWAIAAVVLAWSAACSGPGHPPDHPLDGAPSSGQPPPELAPDQLYLFDPDAGSNFTPVERRDQIEWGPCSDALYRELLRVRREEALSSVYAVTNCAIDAAVDEVHQQRRQLRIAYDANDLKEARRHFARVLYIIQSFYSNTNYIDLMSARYDRPKNVPRFEIWDDAAQQALRQLPELRSGVDPGTSPKVCPEGSPTRLLVSSAGDAASSTAALPRWRGWTRRDAASYFSASAGVRWAQAANRSYPLVLRDCEKRITLVAVLPEGSP